MEWTELKDWKVIGGIITFIAGVVAFFLRRPVDKAETIKARAEASLKYAETKKINRELDIHQDKEITELRRELAEAHELARQLQKKIDKLTVRLSVWETFGPSLKDLK
jgi:uncharacterized coiled-coil protein SlyX